MSLQSKSKLSSILKALLVFSILDLSTFVSFIISPHLNIFGKSEAIYAKPFKRKKA